MDTLVRSAEAHAMASPVETREGEMEGPRGCTENDRHDEGSYERVHCEKNTQRNRVGIGKIRHEKQCPKVL